MRLNWATRLSCVVVVLMAFCGSSLAAGELAFKQPLTVTDLAGRSVSFAKVPQRIILGESRYLFALSILDQANPIERVVGMLADLKRIDYGSYQQYRQKFPQIDEIALVGHTSADSFSVEQVLSLNADLAIFGVEGHGPSARHAQLIEQLQGAGVAVVFVDFRNDPLVNAVKSIELLGRVLGRESRARAYTDYYRQQLQRVTDRLAAMPTEAQPSVFLHSRVGLQDLCCETMVRGMMASFLKQVQAHNVAEPLVPGNAGILNLEYLLTRQPEIYIATAVGASNQNITDPEDRPPYIMLGAGVEERDARATFEYALRHSGVSALQAVKTKKAYAIWHHFYNTPLNVVAVQVFAKWLYPQQFVDLQPRKTLQTLFDRFQSVPLNGTYWLEPEAEQQTVVASAVATPENDAAEVVQ